MIVTLLMIMNHNNNNNSRAPLKAVKEFSAIRALILRIGLEGRFSLTVSGTVQEHQQSLSRPLFINLATTSEVRSIAPPHAFDK